MNSYIWLLMQLPVYPLERDKSRLTYSFVSKGPQGLITKQVQFALLHEGGVYNLAFGDLDPQTQQLNDQAASNNGDLEVVLATVVAAAYDFCRYHPGASILVVGSTPARTRLYRISITRYLSRLQTQFAVYGELGERWEPFQLNQPYTAFYAHPNSYFDDYI